ncbi:MAG: macrolide ABC transporter ATP-binding protein [Spirochaetes bacterium GWF1_49_6]|jgi:putative ABC transport system ATP-binding protein|nr:MAG: macrolide ABC transporter ATP-binding protein [Spirochaetes bacterium GWF1_49_6]
MESIRVYNLNKTYGQNDEKIKVQALKSITLTLETNKIYAIMGHSGSGKSTLMHILGLLDRPSSGQYFLNNRDVSKLSDRQQAHIRNREIGFVFQAYNLLPRYSVYKNVEMPMTYSTVSGSDRKIRINRLLEQVGLGHRIHHKPNELSGGERQRVAIARALVMNPTVILADEPTGNLDTKTEKEIMALLTELKDDSRTIVLVTHEVEIAEYADAIIKIRDGEVIE